MAQANILYNIIYLEGHFSHPLQYSQYYQDFHNGQIFVMNFEYSMG